MEKIHYPKEMKIDSDKGLPVEKAIFSKEEYLEVMKTIDQKVREGV